MHNLLAAIVTTLTGSALSTDVGGRIYEGQAPEQAVYPNVVFMVVVSTPADTFTEQVEDTLVQFSLRSTSESLTEITTMYAHLRALFDDATLTVTGGTNVRTQRENLTPMWEDITTAAGTVGCRHWAVDYSIMVRS